MAMKFHWNDATKLVKLVEALDDNTLTFYSTLHVNVHSKFQLVHKKINARFGPKEPSFTVQNQLVVLQQNVDENLEKFVDHAQQLALDVWGDASENTVDISAMNTFLCELSDEEAVLATMNKIHTL